MTLWAAIAVTNYALKVPYKMCRKKWISWVRVLSTIPSVYFNIFSEFFFRTMRPFLVKALKSDSCVQKNKQTEASFVYKIKDLQFVRNFWIIFVDTIKNECVQLFRIGPSIGLCSWIPFGHFCFHAVNYAESHALPFTL